MGHPMIVVGSLLNEKGTGFPWADYYVLHNGEKEQLEGGNVNIEGDHTVKWDRVRSQEERKLKKI